MLNDMETPGITFELQWKKKSGCQEDVTRIGLWDPDDSTLNWQTFKSYVCQNLGTMDNINVAYIDSEGDELPIESECEFQEALKFAQLRAIKGNKTILIVDREDSVDLNQPTPKFSESFFKNKIKSSTLSFDKQKHLRCNMKTQVSNNSPKLQCHPAMKSSEESTLSFSNGKKKRCMYTSSDAEKSECKCEDMELSKLVMQLKEMKFSESEVPCWFKKYMQKMKADIVAEITTNVMHEMQILFANKFDSSCFKSSSLPINKKKKKKISDEESSDGTLGCESREHILLKKLEKLHKREKKLEKKLNMKLEKLENKTKKMIEKKSQSKAREKVPEQKKYFSCMKRSGDLHVGTYLMDAVLLNEDSKNEIHVHPGEHFTKIWEIINAGTLPWTDKTELRQAWGTSGLEPEDTVVKCPILQPGEQGTISVNFRAPEFPGTFESYWHFYHMGDRFGHWVCCAVVVQNSHFVTSEDTKKEWASRSGLNDSNSHVLNQAADSCAQLKSEGNFISKVVRNQLTSNVNDKSVNSAIPTGSVYESDLESDNLSVVTFPGTASDSEDEKFVVIPMPACFVCDVPLETKDTIPVVVKQDVKNSCDENRYSEEAKCRYQEMKCMSQDIANGNGQIIEETFTSNDFEHESPSQIIYAGDMSGRFVAVNVKENTKSFNRPSGSTSAMEPFPNTTSPFSVSFAVSSTVVAATDVARTTPTRTSTPIPVENLTDGGGDDDCDIGDDNNNNDDGYGKCGDSLKNNIPEEIKRTGTRYSYRADTFNFNTGTCSQTKSNSQNLPGANFHQTSKQTSSGNFGQEQLHSVIQILPETLVSGAVNVASSAISTACAVISNLRNRQHADASEQWSSNISSVDEVMEKSLKNLSEMGFTDVTLNTLLLKQHDHDISQVVACLVAHDPEY